MCTHCVSVVDSSARHGALKLNRAHRGHLFIAFESCRDRTPVSGGDERARRTIRYVGPTNAATSWELSFKFKQSLVKRKLYPTLDLESFYRRGQRNVFATREYASMYSRSESSESMLCGYRMLGKEKRSGNALGAYRIKGHSVKDTDPR